MILLVTEYDDIAWDLHYSLLCKRGSLPVITLESDFNLPEDVQSIWSALYKGYDFEGMKPLHINDFPIPLEWEVEREDGKFLIKSVEGVVGEVIMAEPTINRIISEVHWYDSQCYTDRKDYYNQYGFMYKSSTYVKDIGLVGSQFYSPKNQLLATWNHQTDSVIVGNYIFSTTSEFYLHCIKELGYYDEGIIFNNLGVPLQLLLSRYKEDVSPPQSELIFTEKVVELPQNLYYILQHPELNIKCSVGGFEGARNFANSEDNVEFFEFCCPSYAEEKTKVNNHVLITTATDDLWSIEELVNSCDEVTFNIAAPTLMSSKLTKLEKRSNVNLYPQAISKTVEELMAKSAIFLDIANSYTVFDANKLALRYRCLRLGIKGISSGQYISEINMISEYDLEWLKDFLKYVSKYPDPLTSWVYKENYAIGYSYL